MLKSISFGPGIYQFEFLEDKIAVAKWEEPQRSTIQWVKIGAAGDFRCFYLEGTNVDNIRVVPCFEKECAHA